jgi:hypothetical protein
MIEPEIVEGFIRAKVVLQEKLAEIGNIPGSSEVESQIMFIETRANARAKQAILHGTEEIYALKHILNCVVSSKSEEDK